MGTTLIRITSEWVPVLDSLPTSARVLDVGGASHPLGRADFVLDIRPYRHYTSKDTKDGKPPRFCRSSWVQVDACSADHWPLEDKSFDFVFCSHLLEDVRDPLRVCREMSRVGKAGYVETPSREMESTRGIELRWELPGQAGCYHHRWLCEVRGGEMVLFHKPGFMHGSRLYTFPRRLKSRWVSEKRDVTGILWQDVLPAREEVVPNLRDFQELMRRFVVERTGYNASMWFYDKVFMPVRAIALRMRGRLRRRAGVSPDG